MSSGMLVLGQEMTSWDLRLACVAECLKAVVTKSMPLPYERLLVGQGLTSRPASRA